MKAKLNPNVYLNILMKAEAVLEGRHLLQKQAEVEKFNKSWFVRVKLCKMATLENHAEVMDIWSCDSFWTKAKIASIEKEIEAVLFAISASSKEFIDLNDVEVGSNQLAWLNKIISSQPKEETNENN